MEWCTCTYFHAKSKNREKPRKSKCEACCKIEPSKSRQKNIDVLFGPRTVEKSLFHTKENAGWLEWLGLEVAAGIAGRQKLLVSKNMICEMSVMCVCLCLSVFVDVFLVVVVCGHVCGAMSCRVKSCHVVSRYDKLYCDVQCCDVHSCFYLCITFDA